MENFCFLKYFLRKKTAAANRGQFDWIKSTLKQSIGQFADQDTWHKTVIKKSGIPIPLKRKIDFKCFKKIINTEAEKN